MTDPTACSNPFADPSMISLTQLKDRIEADH